MREQEDTRLPTLIDDAFAEELWNLGDLGRRDGCDDFASVKHILG
jgi:hypothetical protein